MLGPKHRLGGPCWIAPGTFVCAAHCSCASVCARNKCSKKPLISLRTVLIQPIEYSLDCKRQSIMYRSAYSVPRERKPDSPFVFCPEPVAHPELFPFTPTSVDWQCSVTAPDRVALLTAPVLEGMSTLELTQNHWTERRGNEGWLFGCAMAFKARTQAVDTTPTNRISRPTLDQDSSRKRQVFFDC